MMVSNHPNYKPSTFDINENVGNVLQNKHQMFPSKISQNQNVSNDNIGPLQLYEHGTFTAINNMGTIPNAKIEDVPNNIPSNQIVLNDDPKSLNIYMLIQWKLILIPKIKKCSKE